ncbi:MAG TPA: aminotransferase class V-fold PLP-dependent enzyme [Aggregatilineaceae bacterium]|nr:aminotransferase class V-fold PLP-dependent enzyme [Aggregatilineaceae bacterium]
MNPSQPFLNEAYVGGLTEFKQTYPFYNVEEHDALREREYGRLDRLGHVYLDYTGGGLYAESQLEAHMRMLRDGVYGNPHSSNPTSQRMTDLAEHARAYVLGYFDASPDEYTVIFTQNASGALKLVGESYPFGPGDRYVLTFDNHNSVNGIREFARSKGATFTYAPVMPPELRIDEARLLAQLDQAKPGTNNLFAYPAQSNFSGVQHSMEWITRAQEKGWDVLLDAAAFAPSNQLDLSRWHPDFVSLSFYKIFGYPTGVGCLIARRDKLNKLRRPWFAGGTITIASVQGDGYYLREGEAAFEDGTIDYLNIPAIEIGLRHIASVGIETIHYRVMCLTDWLIRHLLDLRHENGMPLIHFYGPTHTQMRGGTVTINMFDAAGKLFDYRDVEAKANQVNISLRTGCFCNPGAGEQAHGLSREDLADCFGKAERMTFESFIQAMSGRIKDAVGAIRVSVGIASTFSDVYRFIEFARTFLNRPA